LALSAGVCVADALPLIVTTFTNPSANNPASSSNVTGEAASKARKYTSLTPATMLLQFCTMVGIAAHAILIDFYC
jgi:hypothetical protein